MNNQEAINMLRNLEKSLDDYCGLNDEGKCMFNMAVQALEMSEKYERIMSAQTEIIRCIDCKHYRKSKGECRRTYKRNSVPKNWFCAGAERREKRQTPKNKD